ncbi:MAG: zinc ribbon domain-containing protein [Candidatus Aureabacteria bacterium]|nr:zinc ribbon domain-containing protein [Candidatus Auribacterota bacterium]
MPLFEYRCGACARTFELLHLAGRKVSISCPACGSRRAARLFSRFGFRSGSAARASAGGSGCAGCTPSPGRCGSCGGH